MSIIDHELFISCTSDNHCAELAAKLEVEPGISLESHGTLPDLHVQFAPEAMSWTQGKIVRVLRKLNRELLTRDEFTLNGYVITTDAHINCKDGLIVLVEYGRLATALDTSSLIKMICACNGVDNQMISVVSEYIHAYGEDVDCNRKAHEFKQTLLDTERNLTTVLKTAR